jgi:hypothetical protein
MCGAGSLRSKGFVLMKMSVPCSLSDDSWCCIRAFARCEVNFRSFFSFCKRQRQDGFLWVFLYVWLLTSIYAGIFAWPGTHVGSREHMARREWILRFNCRKFGPFFLVVGIAVHLAPFVVVCHFLQPRGCKCLTSGLCELMQMFCERLSDKAPPGAENELRHNR